MPILSDDDLATLAQERGISVEEVSRIMQNHEVERLMHDPVMKLILDEGEWVQVLFRECLPEPLASFIDHSVCPVIVKDSFVNEALGQSFADRVVNCKARFDGKTLDTKMVCENKAWQDLRVLAQRYDYHGRVIRGKVKRGSRREFAEMPVTVMLVLYIGEAKWRMPSDMVGLLTGPRWYREQFGLQYFVIDFRRLDVSTLQLDDCPPVKTYVYIVSRQPLVEVAKCFASLDRDSEIFNGLLNYAMKVYRVGLREFLALISTHGEQDMVYLEGSVMDQLVQKYSPGWIATGKTEGKAETLIKLLESRFGEVIADIRERVAKATNDQIDAWSVAVLTAKDLDSVFQPKQQN